MRHRRLAGGLLTALVLLFASASQAGAAQVDYFLKIDGIGGESQLREGEIEVLSWSWGLVGPSPSGGGGGTGTGKPEAKDFSFTKRMDKTSPLLMVAAASGKQMSCARLTMERVERGDKRRTGFMVIKFTDVIISSYQAGGSAGDALPNEQISFNFTNIVYEHRSGPVAAGWDFVKNSETQFSAAC